MSRHRRRGLPPCKVAMKGPWESSSAANCPKAGLRSAVPVSFFPRVAYSPKRVRSVVAHQKRTIRSHRYTDGTAPGVAIGQHEAGEEVFILAAGVAGLVQRNANHLVADPHRFVPGAVLGGKNVSLVFCRKLLALIKSKL